ncbi:MAG: addiction module protein [Candidatus Cloacimonadota bacterium]|nr:addiction module protein [Candidatus Cloacimonadota bacterium]
MIEKHTRLNITLPNSIVNELFKVAEELNDKRSRIIARALELYFDELDGQIADKRWKEYKEGKTKAIPADEVYKDLDI